MMRATLPMVLALAAALIVPAIPASTQTQDENGAQNDNGAQGASVYEMLDLFETVFRQVKQDYVEEVSDEELIRAAVNGMLSSLDPHSSYMDPDSFGNMQVQTRGEFGGLGIEVTMENGLVKVVSPIDDTPAARAGVEAGDLITHIDGEQVLGLTLSDAVERMRGKVGTDITITVRREGIEPFDITITRDKITIEAVRSRLEGNVGYVRISSFSERAEVGLIEALDDFKKELGDDLAGIVLDLRNNPGGLLPQAVKVADVFLEQGEVVSTRGRIEDSGRRFMAEAGDLADGKPLVVLINGGSASASEIVAGALQDHKRAIVMGTKSFGKGSVQTVIPLGDQGAMRLTTARYYTPSGVSIQAKGIEPDIFVPRARVEALEPTRPPRREADLRGALDNGQGESGETPEAAPSEEAPGAEEAEGATPEVEEDYQLSRALDLVRGIALYGVRPVN